MEITDVKMLLVKEDRLRPFADIIFDNFSRCRAPGKAPSREHRPRPGEIMQSSGACLKSADGQAGF
jgi:hypothetical protein